MFKLYNSGEYSLKRLTETLFKDGLRNNNGNKIYKSRIYELLTDPFYYGKIRWNGKIYDGNHKALIVKDLFEQVQQRLKSKSSPKYNKHFFLFKKFIKCQECGGIITWEIHKGHVYGHCNHYKDCSQKSWIKENEVENQLSGVFDKFTIQNEHFSLWIRKALKDSHKDEVEYHANSLNELKSKYDRLVNRLDKLYDDKLDEKITQSFYDIKFKQYSEEKEMFYRQLINIPKQIPSIITKE